MKRNRSRDHETRIHERGSRGRKKEKRKQKRREEKRGKRGREKEKEREREKDGKMEVILHCFHRDAIKDAILDRN